MTILTDNETKETYAGGLLERLRAITPGRNLTPTEARFIAERQATMLIRELHLERPALPHAALTGLSFLTVAQHNSFSASALSTYTGHGWLILLKSDEPKVRQRFSLAHELKHILDDPFNPRRLYPALGHSSSHERTERICDYFAGCLLMPKRWLMSDWCSGKQNIERLSQRYHVSRAAMRVRLSQLGLLAPTPRCLGVEQEVWA
jgi:predicted transcriptional regulator